MMFTHLVEFFLTSYYEIHIQEGVPDMVVTATKY